uniref:Uncharacterized protein n=1 Tax=Trichobilharzia regenti TaxID=157069 RepID=A0AA85K051_TRIRE|nr:unnamed protein product [Trichobilharzia regenti]
MDSVASGDESNQTDIETSYQGIKKVFENYQKFTGPDVDLNELYSSKLNLSHIRDDYETIERELSKIQANCQRARTALLAAGFQCPDVPNLDSS